MKTLYTQTYRNCLERAAGLKTHKVIYNALNYQYKMIPIESGTYSRRNSPWKTVFSGTKKACQRYLDNL